MTENTNTQSPRLTILKKSLDKKKALFDDKLNNHFATVKQANGQPLNDKRNGQATLAKWDRQNETLSNLRDSIEKTENAIEIEEGKILECENMRRNLPDCLIKLIESGKLKQWRKHPRFFFVDGVDKARISYDKDEKTIGYRYLSEIKCKDQYAIFRDTFNALNKEIKNLSESK